MKQLVALVKKRQNNITQHVLSQVDLFGQVLTHFGVNNRINRHTLIGQAWMKKHRIDGEILRLDIKLQSKLKTIKTIQSSLDTSVNNAIDILPPALAQRARSTHSTLKRITGGC